MCELRSIGLLHGEYELTERKRMKKFTQLVQGNGGFYALREDGEIYFGFWLQVPEEVAAQFIWRKIPQPIGNEYIFKQMMDPANLRVKNERTAAKKDGKKHPPNQQV